MNEIPEQPITRVEKYLDAILKNGGGGGGSFERFVITLTPTYEDFSGTIDASWTDIEEAYNEGKLIVGHILFYQDTIIETLPTVINSNEEGVFMVQFELVDPNTELYIVAVLDAATPGAYYTHLYTMTSYP